ncbi:hypothetical protein TELCIR_20928 [Teladorsagia circumcincta]|uniref:Peptidase M12A domain-containing protein n=1 Tax=Teladorsagia circumcincta TaxID=45464 RepID=A0A2G9TJE1_TELCI|nr:hypothetical protein TELCIR_20928 [Teladorsagia circumcincta]
MNPKACQFVAIVASLLALLDSGLCLSDNGRASLIRGPAEASDGSGGGSIIEKNRLGGVDEYLFEGDINLTEEQLSALEASLNNRTTRQKRQASKTATLWANKKVFYYFDPSIGEPMKSLVKKALSYISARTCLTFTENAAAVNRIRVFSGD